MDSVLSTDEISGQLVAANMYDIWWIIQDESQRYRVGILATLAGSFGSIRNISSLIFTSCRDKWWCFVEVKNQTKYEGDYKVYARPEEDAKLKVYVEQHNIDEEVALKKSWDGYGAITFWKPNNSYILMEYNVSFLFLR